MKDIKLDMIMLDEILDYIKDENVTDINWNGRDLWIDDLERGRYLSSLSLSKKFIENLSTRLSNLVNLNFNKHNPLLEAETKELRISIIHESVSHTGRSMSIRKTPGLRRLSREKIISSGYCSKEFCEFMEIAIKSHCNIVIGGLPSVGKTEYLKYLTNYIPAHERVVTLEDNLEIHYSSINPGKDCVEIKIAPGFGFEKAISASLRHNAKWTLLSEARGNEVIQLMNSLSDGTHCLTTLHVENAVNIPDRLLTMTGNTTDDRFINNIYSFIDIGLIIRSDVKKGEKITRWIEEAAIFYREEKENKAIIIYENGRFNKKAFEEIIKYKRKFMDIKIKGEKKEDEETFMEAV